MRTPLVLHVPHASTAVPDECLADFAVSRARLAEHLAASTDHFTDELFASDEVAGDVACVRFPVSRLVVDPERFEDDACEPMARHGLGVLYDRGHDGTPLRVRPAPTRREWYLDRWYRPHHAALTQAVDAALARAGRVLVVDCHSYPDVPLALDLDQSVPRPDACIGTAGMHTPGWLVDAARRWAAQQGWSLGIDAPYAGAVVPAKHLGRDARVHAVMVEVNRARYMRLDGTQARRTAGFAAAREFVAGMVDALRGAVDAAAPARAMDSTHGTSDPARRQHRHHR